MEEASTRRCPGCGGPLLRRWDYETGIGVSPNPPVFFCQAERAVIAFDELQEN